MKFIKVIGEGKVEVKPEQTVIEMELVATDADYAKAMTKAAESVSAIESALEKAGLSSGLTTAEFSADAAYENQNDGGTYKRVFVGYSIKQRLKLAFGYSDHKLFKAINALAESGAAPAINVRFTVKDKKALVREAIKRAVKDATEKADALASAAGLEIEGIESVIYGKGNPKFVSDTQVSPMLMRASAVPNVIPEDVTIVEYADATFRVRSGKKK